MKVNLGKKMSKNLYQTIQRIFKQRGMEKKHEAKCKRHNHGCSMQEPIAEALNGEQKESGKPNFG